MTGRGKPPTQASAPARFPVPPTRVAVPDWYPELRDAVTDCVRAGRQRAVSAANQQLVSTYWWAMGTEILARQDVEGWGARVIDRLSADLRERFPDASGFSPRNLKYMRAFAAAWPEETIVQAPLAQLRWYHHVALLDKLDSADLRLCYAQAAIEQGRSRNVLVHHIEGQFHKRAGLPEPATTSSHSSCPARCESRMPRRWRMMSCSSPRGTRRMCKQRLHNLSRSEMALAWGPFVQRCAAQTWLALSCRSAWSRTDLASARVVAKSCLSRCQSGGRRSANRCDRRSCACSRR